MSSLTAAPGDVGAALASVRARIAAAADRAGRDPAAVRLVAVTKTVPAARVAAIVEAGVLDLGENRVQEANAKRQELPSEVRWHLIGHLQTNKAGRAAALFDWVHSVDSERIAEALAARRQPEAPDLDVLLEVELTGLPGHTGYAAESLVDAVRNVGAIPRLRLRGLMTMAPLVDDAEAARPTFARLRDIAEAVRQEAGLPLEELSMGMSDDFEVAVEEGSTLVRLGRALFGPRPPRHG